MKKLTALAIALTMLLSFAACNSEGGGTAEADVTTKTAAETEAVKDETTTAATEETTEATTTEPVVEATPVEDFEFKEYVDGEITITKYKGSEAEVIIPAEIDGKPVTTIGGEAFVDCKSVTDITFPDSVREVSLIGLSDDEFNYYMNSGLTPFLGTPWLEKKREENPLVIVNNIVVNGSSCSRDVEIPEGVTCIANCAFGSSVTSISLPESLEIIGEGAFYRCSRLTDIVIPDSVNKIGTFAFGGCAALENVTFPNNTVEMGRDIFGYDGYEIPWFANKKAENPLVIVNGNLIDAKRCTGDVVIPDSVKSIADRAFYKSGITSVQLPDGMTKIPDNLFYECRELKSVKIPDSVTEIGSGAFKTCGLESITIPSSVTEIDDSAFANCPNLKSVTLSEGLKKIGSSIFASDYKINITELTLPDRLESIAEDAFKDCKFDITYKGEVYFPELYKELYAEINGN